MASWLALTILFTRLLMVRRMTPAIGPTMQATSVSFQFCQRRTPKSAKTWSESRTSTTAAETAPPKAMLASFTNFDVTNPVEFARYAGKGSRRMLAKSSMRSVTSIS